MSFLVFLSFMFTGCRTVVVTEITSTPEGVLITLDRHYMGKTPLKCKVRGKPGFDNIYKFTAIKEGYKPQTKVFRESPFAIFERVKTAVPLKIHFKMEPAPEKQQK